MPIKKFLNSNLAGFKLVLASAAVGNVGQLSCDLMIEILGMEKYGMLINDAIIPLVGPPTFTKHTDMTTAAEFFISDVNKILLLQIRTPLFNGSYDGFCDEILNFIRAEGISELVILSSTFSYEQHCITKSPFEYIKNAKVDATIAPELFVEASDSIEKGLQGSGVALPLFKKATDSDIKTIIFYKYVSEGDNRQDALGLLLRVSAYLNNPINEKIPIKEPPSWKFMFGNSVKTEIY